MLPIGFTFLLLYPPTQQDNEQRVWGNHFPVAIQPVVRFLELPQGFAVFVQWFEALMIAIYGSLFCNRIKLTPEFFLHLRCRILEKVVCRAPLVHTHVGDYLCQWPRYVRLRGQSFLRSLAQICSPGGQSPFRVFSYITTRDALSQSAVARKLRTSYFKRVQNLDKNKLNTIESVVCYLTRCRLRV